MLMLIITHLRNDPHKVCLDGIDFGGLSEAAMRCQEPATQVAREISGWPLSVCVCMCVCAGLDGPREVWLAVAARGCGWNMFD